MTNYLEQAIDILGSQQKLADSVGVSQPTVWHWINAGNKRVPAEYCLGIEEATGGKVTKEMLRPDIFGSRKSKKKNGGNHAVR